MSKVYLVTFVGMAYDVDSKVLAEALSKRGVRVDVVGWDDPNVDWESPDLCVVKSASNYMIKPEPFLEWAEATEERCPLWNRRATLAWNSDKHYLLELQEKGVPMPPTIIIDRGSVRSLKQVLGSVDWDEIVIKPTISAGSFGLKKFRRDSIELDEHVGQIMGGCTQYLDGVAWQLAGSDAIIQPYIPEILNGESSLIYFGGEFSHAVIKRAKSGDFRSHPIWGAKVEWYEPSKEELRVARKALSVVGNVEYARLDMVMSSGGPLLIEMELIEPFFFFDMFPETAETYADHIADSL